MTFTATQVRENWGPEGLDVVNDLMRVHGTETLPDPVRDETLKDYVQRCARSGLCHVVGDLHTLQDVRAYRAADERASRAMSWTPSNPSSGVNIFAISRRRNASPRTRRKCSHWPARPTLLRASSRTT